MKNEYKIHDIGQPDWVQLGIEVYAWDDCSNGKIRGVLIGYDRKSNYPYMVASGDLTSEEWQYAEPVLSWTPQPGELVAIEILGACFLRVSAGGSHWINDGRIGASTVCNHGAYSIYRLPEGVPLHELPSDPEWWEQHAEKYEEVANECTRMRKLCMCRDENWLSL